MKRSIFLLLLLVSTISFGQSFLPMLDEDHSWSVDVNYCPIGGIPPPYTATSQISIIGETTIDGKVFKEIVSTQSNFPPCYMREANGRIYRYNEIDNSEEIVLDFNLEVGDTFFFTDSPSCLLGEGTSGLTAELEVLNTYTDFIAGEDRKVIEFQTAPWNIEYWIEGIGSISGGIEPYSEVLDITCSAKMVCFTKNGITYFFNSNSCDNTTLGLPIEMIDQIVLAPNPIENRSILQLPLTLSIQSVRIFDVSGRQIKEYDVTKDYIILDAMEFRSGLYFYQAVSNNEVLMTEKFVVK